MATSKLIRSAIRLTRKIGKKGVSKSALKAPKSRKARVVSRTKRSYEAGVKRGRAIRKQFPNEYQHVLEHDTKNLQKILGHKVRISKRLAGKNKDILRRYRQSRIKKR